jgi:serine/threonine protein kinase
MAEGTPTPIESAPRFAPGTTLVGRYRLIRFIAAGGMGEVHEAEDLVLGTRVAVKTIRAAVAGNCEAMERFRREALLARRVTHPNVCRTFDAGHDASAGDCAGVTFLTMELLRGETLRQRLRRRGAFRVEEALPIVEQMAAGLTAAHRAGVIHRDFKSANVMLVPAASADEPRVVVTDFGVARAIGGGFDSMTDVPQIVGTPAYVAPEQVEDRDVTAAADIYAFGVVLYEMMTERLPFTGNSPAATLLKRFRERPTPPRLYAKSLPPEWEAAILRCLEREPGDRFATAEDAVKALVSRRRASMWPGLTRLFGGIWNRF